MEEKQNKSEVINNSNKFNKIIFQKYLKLTALIIFFMLVGVTGYLLGFKKETDITNNQASPPIEIIPSPKAETSDEQNSRTDKWKIYSNPELNIKFIYPANLESTEVVTDDEIIRFEKPGIGTLVLSRSYYDLSVDQADKGCLKVSEQKDVASKMKYTRAFYMGGGFCYLDKIEYLQSFTTALGSDETPYYLYYLQYWNPKNYDDDRYNSIYGPGIVTFTNIVESIESSLN